MKSSFFENTLEIFFDLFNKNKVNPLVVKTVIWAVISPYRAEEPSLFFLFTFKTQGKFHCFSSPNQGKSSGWRTVIWAVISPYLAVEPSLFSFLLLILMSIKYPNHTVCGRLREFLTIKNRNHTMSGILREFYGYPNHTVGGRLREFF